MSRPRPTVLLTFVVGDAESTTEPSSAVLNGDARSEGLIRRRGDHAWHDQAACRSTGGEVVDPMMFFPKPDDVDRIRGAKALCGQCTVRGVCLQAALENGDRDGIWGGMTEEEREPLHRVFQYRLNRARVNAVLEGRDIFLTSAERQAAVQAAYQAGVPVARLAWLLQVSEEHAGKLYRRTRREIRNRNEALVRSDGS